MQPTAETTTDGHTLPSGEIVVGFSRPFPRLVELLTAEDTPSWRFLQADEYGDGGLARLVSECEVLVVHGETVDAQLLGDAPAVRMIVKCGAGLDSIDLSACAERGILVRSCPDSVTASAAEFAIGLMLAAARRIPFKAGSPDEGVTEAEAVDLLELSGRRLGIVGYGRIGQAVAAIARAAGMEVGFSDPAHEPGTVVAGATAASMADLFATADVISVHVPGGADTRGVVSAALLDSLRVGSLFVNVSRGSVVDQAGLLAALDSGRVRCAALDVLDYDDPSGVAALRAHPNVIVTPHMAGTTADSRVKLARACRDHLLAYAAGIRGGGRPSGP